MKKMKELPVNDFFAKNGKSARLAAWYMTCIWCR